MDNNIIEQARRAAKSALIEWYTGQWARQSENLDDLHHELLVWYMERPETRNKMSKLSEPEIMVTFRLAAKQILSENTHENNIFMGGNLYSGAAVREALRGESTNKYLYQLIPIAVENIAPSHKAALYKRYTLGVVPTENSERNLLKRAVRSLTDEIGVLYHTDEAKTIGSKVTIFPDTVKPKGGYGDPTGGIALTLMDQHPDTQDEYLYESPWEQVNKGAAAEPIIVFGPSGQYRLTAAEHDLFKRVPGLIDLFIDQKRKEWGYA